MGDVHEHGANFDALARAHGCAGKHHACEKRARPPRLSLAALPRPRFHRTMRDGRIVEKLYAKAERQVHSKRFARLRAVPATYSPEAFLGRPTGKLHPLSRMIQDRGLSVAQAARHLGVDRYALERVLTWRAPACEPMRSRVAGALGIEPDELFPAPPVTRNTFE